MTAVPVRLRSRYSRNPLIAAWRRRSRATAAGAGVLDAPRRVCLAPKDVDDLHPHRLAAFRTHELDQDIDRLGDLLLLSRMRVGEVVAMVLEVFAKAGIDLIEEAHCAALCSTDYSASLAKNPPWIADASPG